MAEMMKSYVFYEAEKMTLEKRPIPSIKDVEVLVKVKNVGICGSDISYYYGLSPVGTPTGKGPLVLGHEFTGQVARVGSVPKALDLFKEGDRVVVNPVQHCNACYNCAAGQTHLCTNLHVPGVTEDGGFQEYSVAHYTGLFKLPAGVDYAAGAFIEPLACAVNGMRKLAIELGQFVAVFGPGPIGLMMLQIAKSMGAGKVALVGTKDYRLEAGRALGADYLLNPRENSSKHYVPDLKKAIADLTGGRLADRVVCATSSNDAFEQGVEVGGNCSIILHFGLPNGDDVFKIPALSFHTMDKQIRSAWLAPLAWPAAIRAIQEGLVKVKPLISHTFPLEDTEKAIRMLKDKTGNPLKIQIAM